MRVPWRRPIDLRDRFLILEGLTVVASCTTPQEVSAMLWGQDIRQGYVVLDCRQATVITSPNVDAWKDVV